MQEADLAGVRPEVALTQGGGQKELHSGKAQALMGAKASLDVFVSDC